MQRRPAVGEFMRHQREEEHGQGQQDIFEQVADPGG